MTGAGDQAAKAAMLFDALADDYDGVGVDFFQPIARSLVHEMHPVADERWLDIGCGTGAVLLEAGRLVGPRGRALGTDISPRMVERCRDLAREQGLADVETRVDDAQAPSLEGEEFDAVSSCLVLFFLHDPAAALVAWRSLLRPGGRLGVTTFGPIDPRWRHVDEVFTAYLPEQLRDARTSGKVGPFESDAAMESLVTSAGFDDVRTVGTSVPVRFRDADQWHAFTWSVGQRAMWLAIPEEERPVVRAEAERRLATHAAVDGSITFDQAVRHTLAVRPT